MIRFKSSKTTFMAVLLLSIMIFSSGCVYLIVGGLGAVGGYVVSPDTVEGVLGYDYVDIWDSAVEVTKVMGNVEEESEQTGSIIAKVNGAHVNINLVRFSENSTMLRVKARKSLLPKISVAQDVFIKIVRYLD